MSCLFTQLLCYSSARRCLTCSFFFFNDTATTEIYTLSLHDALPISHVLCAKSQLKEREREREGERWLCLGIRVDFVCRNYVCSCAVLLVNLRVLSLSQDRKSTRLNSSHLVISYAVFCLKKKKKKNRY